MGHLDRARHGPHLPDRAPDPVRIEESWELPVHLLLWALREVGSGADPDLVMLELYANAIQSAGPSQ